MRAMTYDPAMNYDAVLIDAAETLFTTRGSVGAIYGGVARRFGCTTPAPEIQKAFQRQFRHSGPLTTENEKQWWKDVVHRVFSDVGMVPDFDRFFEEVYENFRDSRGWVLFAETHEVLDELKRCGLKLGVISNFDSRIYSVMRSLKILEFFDDVTISSETGYAKPHPGIFRAAIAACDEVPGRILFVGDNPVDDVEAGQAAGLHAVLIDRTGRYSGLSSLRRIENLRGIVPLLWMEIGN